MGDANLPISDILVDSREQRPYWTVDEGATRMALPTGDYSVRGLEGRVAVERKSVADLLSSLGGRGGCRRKRLEAEFRRLGQMEWGAVVVEGSDKDIFSFPRRGRIGPAHAIMTLASWGTRYGVYVWCASGRVAAKSWTRQYLRLAARKLGGPPG